MTLIAMYFRKHWLQKTWLDKSLKSCVQEDPSTGNMKNGSKHCCHLNDSHLTISIDHSGGNYGRKGLF